MRYPNNKNGALEKDAPFFVYIKIIFIFAVIKIV